MAKKTQAKAQTKKTQAQEYDNGVVFNSRDVIVASCKTVKETSDYSIDTYELAPYITLDICYLDKATLATLNIHGVAIKGNVIKGKNGLFIALPQYKKTNGEYTALVTIFNKDMNDAIKSVMECVEVNLE